MGECVRIRVEFRNCNDKSLKSVLFVFKKKENETIKQLSMLIKNRFQIKHNISLFIDGFLLQNDETIEVVRDNDLIVVEPAVESKPKYVPKPKSVLLAQSIKTENAAKPKQNRNENSRKRQKTKQTDDSSDSGNSVSHGKELTKKPKIKSSNNLDVKNECIDTTVQQMDATISIKTEPIEQSNELSDDLLSDVYSNRNTPLRKAFKAANKCLSDKPANTVKLPSRTPSKRQTPKRHLSREAREPVDKYSPIIPIKDLKLDQQYSHLITEFNLSINGNKIKGRKQSARKTFPTPSNISNTGKSAKTNVTAKTTSTLNTTANSTATTNYNTNSYSNAIINDSCIINNVVIDESKVTETIERESNSNDYSDCEPLGEVPNIGDLIAFKILTQSKTSGLPEASKFQKGSVINRRNSMIDVLIENNNNNDITDTSVAIDERRVQILKIDWSTVIEPKIIQRQHLLLSDSI